ncbi:MAG: hypothetical protein ATN35_00855 [Epulopiscium sp. Nele67-Bin004]|nr:MAG: hypothetical protein ATN35_00855 [Epulopiscium sp. Nele67-Bin004]
MEKIAEYEHILNPRKVEIIDDIVYMSPAPSVKHHNIMGNIWIAFKNYLRGKKCKPRMECNVYFNPDKPKQHVIPDVAILCEPDKMKPNGYYGAPSLIVEILSTNKRDDLVIKFDLYQKLGVGEYWIVEPLADTITQYILVDGKYERLGVYYYLTPEEIEDLEESQQSEYKSFITPELFKDLDISLEEIFED